MKKKSSSQSAFFNLRVLIGLLIGTTGVSLALLAANPFGHGVGPARTSKLLQLQYAKSPIENQLVPPGLIPITQCRSLSPTTTHEGATSPLLISPEHRSPPMAVLLLTGSPVPILEEAVPWWVKAPSPIPRATPLFSTTGRPVPGSPSGSGPGPAAGVSAATGPPHPRIHIVGPVTAFTVVAPATTESPAGWMKTHPLPLPTGCTYPGMTSLVVRASLCVSPLTTVSPGPTSDRSPPLSSATCRSRVTRSQATSTSQAWTRWVVASPTAPIKSTARLTAATPGPILTLVLHFLAQVAALPASSPRCMPTPST